MPNPGLLATVKLKQNNFSNNLMLQEEQTDGLPDVQTQRHKAGSH